MLSSLSSHKGELKSQGAVEAARDPNSSITAEDAEQVMLEESKKAGTAAYRFDPNASPEDKAAVARAVCRMSPILQHPMADSLIEHPRQLPQHEKAGRYWHRN